MEASVFIALAPEVPVAGLVAATHVFREILRQAEEVVDGRDEPGQGPSVSEKIASN
jgi:hypothetical protein